MSTLEAVRVYSRLLVKTDQHFPLLLRSMFTAENGSFESIDRLHSTHCQNDYSLVSVSNSQAPQCATVGVEHGGMNSQLFIKLNRASPNHGWDFISTSIPLPSAYVQGSYLSS
jgi:hypothetical protein